MLVCVQSCDMIVDLQDPLSATLLSGVACQLPKTLEVNKHLS